MTVRQLGIYGYRGPDDLEWGETIRDPSWPEVESSIKRLDANEYAGVVLHLSYREEDDPATEYFWISGGPDGFAFAYRVDGRYLQYVVPGSTERGEDVGIIQRDQGVWLPAGHVCRDLEDVLKAADWFFQYAEPHPELSWGKFGRSHCEN